MVNVLGSLVVKIGADTQDLNAKLKQVSKEVKANTEGFKKLSSFGFKFGAALTAYAGGVFLFLQKAASMASEALGDPAFMEAQQNLQDSLDSLMTTIGISVLPLLTDLINAFSDWIDKLNESNPGLVQFMGVFLLITGVLAGVLAPLGLIIGVVGQLAALFGTGGLLAGATAIFLPLIAIIGVLALAWITNFANIQQQTQIVIGGIMQIINGFVKILSGDFSGIKDILFGIWNSIFVGIGGFLFNILKEVFKWGVKLAQAFEEIMLQVRKLIIDGINVLIDLFVQQINSLIASINQISRAAGGGDLFQKVSSPRIDTSGIDQEIAASRYKGAAATNAINAVTINFNDFTIDSDQKLNELVQKVSDAITGQVKNQTAMGRGGA